MLTTQGIFYEPSIYTSAAAETVALVTGASAVLNGAKLLGFVAHNTSSSTAYVQVFDAYAAPPPSAVPIASIQVMASSMTSFDAGVFNYIPMKYGIVIALSSTLATYTAVTTHLFVAPCGFIAG